MPRRFARFFGISTALALASCQVALTVPSGSEIGCTTNDDCPTGRLCSSDGACLPDINDSTGPVLQSVSPESETQIVAVFDEELLLDSATSAASYEFTPALTLTADPAVSTDRQRVQLSVTGQEAGTTYTLTVLGVSDRYGNQIQSPSNAQSFVGFGTPPDLSPPDLLSPASNEVVPTRDSTGSPTSVALSWSARTGADSYRLQVFCDLSASPIAELTGLSGTTFILDFATLGAAPCLGTRASTLYWRVQGELPGAAEATGQFEPTGDDVLVFCDSTDACSPATTGATGVQNPEAGNLSAPFRSIDRAVAFATSLGINQVLVAHRGSDEPYREQITLRAGIHLLGGYDTTFTTTAQRIPILSSETVILGAGITADVAPSTLVRGFDILSVDSTSRSFAIALFGADESVEVTDCALRGSNGAIGSAGVSIALGVGLGPRVIGNEISRGESFRDRDAAIRIQDGPAWIEDNTITIEKGSSYDLGIGVEGGLDVVLIRNRFLQSASSISGRAVDVSNSQFTYVAGNIIVLEYTTFGGTGIRLVNSSEDKVVGNQIYAVSDILVPVRGVTVVDSIDSVVIANNVITTAEGVLLIGTEETHIIHNTIAVPSEGCTQPYGVRLVESTPSILNNIFVETPGTCILPPQAGVSLSTSDGSLPTRVQANAVVALAFEAGMGAGGDVNGLDGMPHPAGGTIAGDGNVALAFGGAILTPDDFFVSPTGFDPDPAAALLANDWQLTLDVPTTISEGAIDTIAAAEGPSVLVEQPDGTLVLVLEGIPIDATNAARTAPVSMGAYERD